MTCQQFGNVIICGPSATTVLSKESAGIKWCFVCRKRVEFTETWKRDESPYYDPWLVMECEHGHSDGDLFPGRERWV